MKKGINLVELIVIIAIIGIVTAALVPAASRYLPGIQLTGATRTLASNLREAQEKAVTEQKQYAIRFSSGPTPSYQIINVSTSPEEVQKTVNLKPDQFLSAFGVRGGQVVFSADGGANQSGDIIISNPGKGISKTISISPAGFIKIE